MFSCRFGCAQLTSIFHTTQAYDLWKSRIDKALADRSVPQDGTHEYGSLFQCLDPTTIGLDEFCPDFGSTCQPFNSQFCGTPDDCCVSNH